MKKKYLIFLFLLGFLFDPRETYASATSFDSGTTYATTSCRSDMGCASSSFNRHYESSFKNWWYGIGGFHVEQDYSSGYLNNITIFNALKYQEISIPFALHRGDSYNIILNYQGGSYFRQDWQAFHVSKSTYCNSSVISGCSINWLSGGVDGDYYKATAKITFLASDNATANWVLGVGEAVGSDRILFFNNSNLGQGFRIESATFEEFSNNTDISPMVGQQEETNRKLDETNNKLDSIGGEIVDDTTPSNQDYNDFMGDLPVLSFGPLSSGLQLPIQFINAILNEMTDPYDCSNITFGSLLGTNIGLSCINLHDYLPDYVYNFIVWVCSFYIYYNLVMLIIHTYDTWTSFNDTFNSLYQPKHADRGYKPKHGGGN